MEEAAYLMDRPPGGWGDLVTNQTLGLRFEALDHRFDALEHRLLAEIERRFRAQTLFLVSALITGLGVVGAVVRL